MRNEKSNCSTQIGLQFSCVFVDAQQLIRLIWFFDIGGQFKNWSDTVTMRAEDRRQQTWRTTVESRSVFRGEDKTNFLLIDMKTQPDKIRSFIENNEQLVSLRKSLLQKKSHKWTGPHKTGCFDHQIPETDVKASDPITPGYQISMLM